LCRRIIKVPVREKKGPVDWRTAATRLPSGARRDVEPAPEGAWGSAASAGTVSREALEEADAIPIRKEPWTAKQKVQLSAAVVLGVLVLGGAAWGVVSYVGRNRQALALTRATALADEGKIKSLEEAAEVQRAAGEYLVRAGKVEEARARFQKARGLLMGVKAESTERDLLLIDLALSQVDLGGEQPEVMNKTRLKWEPALKEVGQTLQNVRSPEARMEAVRRVSRKLVARGKETAALALVPHLATGDEVPEAQALVGLELLKAKQDKMAEAVADDALGHYKTAGAPAAPGAEPAKPAPSPSLIALLVAQGKVDKVPAIVPPPSKKEEKTETDPALFVGLAEGMARKGDLAGARQSASRPAQPVVRLTALLAVAEAAVESGQAEAAQPELEEACKLLGDGGGPPWLLFRLVRLGAQAGRAEAVEKYARLIQDPGLRGQAELELLDSRLAATPGPADESLLEAFPKGSVALGLARERLARHNARVGGDVKAIDSWEPDGHRALGHAGQALGLQDAKSH
jgi:hypothetical protein